MQFKLMMLAVLALMYGNVNATIFDFVVKINDRYTAQEISERFQIDTDSGTEILTSSGQQVMFDFNTGYMAVRKDGQKECVVLENDGRCSGNSTDEATRDLHVIQARGGKTDNTETDTKEVEYVEPTGNVLAAVGKQLFSFCGDRVVKVATKKESENTKADRSKILDTVRQKLRAAGLGGLIRKKRHWGSDLIIICKSCTIIIIR